MEVGKYIDFHDKGSTADHDVRITATKGNLSADCNFSINDLSLNSSYPTISFGVCAQANDYARIRFSGGSNAGNLEIATADDANEPIYVRQYKGTFTTAQRTATLLDGSGNTSFPGTLTANNVNATTAVTTPTVNTNTLVLCSSLGLTDFGRIMYSGSDNDGRLEIATSDNGNEPIYVRQYASANGNWTNMAHEITLMDASGNQVFNTVTATNIKADNEERLAAVEAKVASGDIGTDVEELNVKTLKSTGTGKLSWTGTDDTWMSLSPGQLSITNTYTTEGVIVNKSGVQLYGDDYVLDVHRGVTSITMEEVGKLGLTYQILDDGKRVRYTVDPAYFSRNIGYQMRN